MAVADQLLNIVTDSDTAVGATTKTFADVTISQAPGAGNTGRYQLIIGVIYTSSTADVIIDQCSYGTEDYSPDDDPVPTAANRPGCAIFTGGEWPTGDNDLVFDATGGNIASIKYYLFIIEEMAEVCMAPFGAEPRSDNFNRNFINRMWTFDPGDNSGTTVAINKVSSIYRVNFDLPAVSGDYGDEGGNRSPNFTQVVADGDFSVTTHQEELPTGDFFTSSIHAEHPDDSPIEFIRSGVYTFGDSNRYSFVDESIAGSFAFVTDAGALPAGRSSYWRMIRSGDDFNFDSSANGSTFFDIGSTREAIIEVGRIGFNCGVWQSAVTFDIDLFSFINNNGATRSEQDGNTALDFLQDTVAADTAIDVTFTEDTTTGEGVFGFAVIACDDAAGTISPTSGITVLEEGVISGTDGIRFAFVAALEEVSGATSVPQIGGTWSGAANASIAASQYRIDELVETGGTVKTSNFAIVGTAAINITPAKLKTASALLAGTAAINITPAKLKTAGYTLTGTAAINITPAKLKTTSALLAGTAAINITPAKLKTTSALLESTSAIAIVANKIRFNNFAIVGDSTIQITPTKAGSPTVAFTLLGTSTLAVGTEKITPTNFIQSAQSQINIAVNKIKSVSFTLAAQTAIAIAPTKFARKETSFALAAQAAIDITPQKIKRPNFTIAGEGTIVSLVRKLKSTNLQIQGDSAFNIVATKQSTSKESSLIATAQSNINISTTKIKTTSFTVGSASTLIVRFPSNNIGDNFELICRIDENLDHLIPYDEIVTE